MKKLTIMEKRIDKIAEQEAKFGCCSFRGECGMMPNSRCEKILLFLNAPEGYSSRQGSPLFKVPQNCH